MTTDGKKEDPGAPGGYEIVRFDDWRIDVAKYLRGSERAHLFEAALRRAGMTTIPDLRGMAEVEGAYLAGDSPEHYGEFLLNEFEMSEGE